MTITTSVEAAEAVAALLWEVRGGGVVEEPAGEGTVRLRTYVPDAAVSEEALRRLSAGLARLPDFGLTTRVPQLHAAPASAEAWASSWKDHFTPFRVGRRILIAPTWEETGPAPGEVLIRLDPGMAFGSGLHASTQLALILMEERLPGAASVADVGTGSGLLAIAAALLGAARVVAIDDDPVAVAVARANARANGVAARVDVTQGHLLDPVREPVDLITANLTAALLEVLAPSIPSRLHPEGVLVASGIVEEGVAAVRRAFAAAGLDVVEARGQEEWVALVARRGAPALDGRRDTAPRAG